ncbi:MAG: ferrous iron transport protein B [Cyanobacteria bacterium SBLK]|nr:ferrous iron transport protein B [Cyanobacteria bacterium SBLK]
MKTIALFGMPNTGKSTFFNRITGMNASVGNWPGITVDLLQAEIEIDGEKANIVDLPGIYDLQGIADDEKIVCNFLKHYKIDLALVVINVSQIDRQIRLPLQIQSLGLPTILILNMADEAENLGIYIDTEQLKKQLKIPVFSISAKYGQGYLKVSEAIGRKLQEKNILISPESVKTQLDKSQDISSDTIAKILDSAVKIPSKIKITRTERIDSVLLHPIFGLPLFFGGMFGVFWLVWAIGLPSQDVMKNLANWLLNHLLIPTIAPLPEIVRDFLINGLWNGLSIVASFVPLIVLFFILMAVLEDSGYLSRSAYLMDGIMARLGLDGRSFVMQMMGFGCNVPALMGTRVMRSQNLRFLTMLTIPFSLCSARLQVFVFIIAATFPNGNGAFVLFSLYLLSFIAAIATAATFQGTFPNHEPFILELPPYRLPTARQVALRGWGEVRTFLSRASGFIAFGCIAVWSITSLPVGAVGLDTIGGHIGTFLSPIMQPIGIDPYLTLALIFGFIAKEIVIGSLAVIYGLGALGVSDRIAETVTFAGGYSFCIFCLLYTPCLTTIVTLFNEAKSWRFTLLSLVYSLVLAWVGSFLFYQSTRLLAWQ